MMSILHLLYDPRRTPLAWRNVTRNKSTMVMSLVTIAFAVLIMFLEMGFLNGLFDSQAALTNALQADIFIVSRAMHNVLTSENFSQARLEQAAQIDGVRSVQPLWIESRAAYLRRPDDGQENAIRVLGVDPEIPAFRDPAMAELQKRLRLPETVLFDRRSRHTFGEPGEGASLELAAHRVTVTGTFKLTAEYYYDGNLVTGEDTFFALFPWQRHDQVAMGLVRVQPGYPVATVLANLRASLPDDVEFLTADAISSREKHSWTRLSPVADIFDIGIAVGFVIGVVICYQILYTDILNHVKQLATLQAIGYPGREIAGLVIRQGLLTGLLGFLLGLALAFASNAILHGLTGVTMRLTSSRILFVFVLALGSCLLSGLLVVRKALRADPAELY